MSDFFSFLIQSLKHCIFWLVGISLLIGIINRIRGKDWFFKNKTYIRIAVIFLFIGCYQAWHDEHQIWAATQGQLNEEIKKHSGLHGTIEGLYRYKIPNMPGTLVFIEFQIVNRGDPTYAENYYLYVKCAKTNLFCNELSFYPPIDLPAYNSLPKMIFTTNDALYLKTLEPIARGAQKRGWLFYQITNATWDELADTNNEWVISYDDDAQKRYYVTNNNSLLTSSGEMLNMPGAESPIQR